MDTASPEARQPLFDRLHGLFMEDTPMIVWSSGVNVSAYSKAVRGYAHGPAASRGSGTSRWSR